jgi:hypothetical protein
MSDEWEEEQGFYEDDESDNGCDYGVGEFCEDPQTKDAGLCTTECQPYLCSIEAIADQGTSTWKCHVCGCTDTTPCTKYLPGAAIETCHWVRKNLCSECAEKQKQQVQENTDKSIAAHVAFARGE